MQNDDDLTTEQTLEIKIAIKHYFEQKKHLRENCSPPECDIEVLILKHSKAFLDEHQELALHYNCSGRGLPAYDYYNHVKYIGYRVDKGNLEDWVDNEYLIKIKENIDKRVQLINELDNSLSDSNNGV